MKYSGLIAIVVYSVILYLILKLPRKKKETAETETIKETQRVEVERLDPEDEDATVACLVAAIDCRNQYHKNVQIRGVRRIS